MSAVQETQAARHQVSKQALRNVPAQHATQQQTTHLMHLHEVGFYMLLTNITEK